MLLKGSHLYLYKNIQWPLSSSLCSECKSLWSMYSANKPKQPLLYIILNKGHKHFGAVGSGSLGTVEFEVVVVDFTVIFLVRAKMKAFTREKTDSNVSCTAERTH